MQRTRDAGRKVVLLSGGNPQIAKGFGDASVQAYISAMPGWKCAMGRQLDLAIERAVPNVLKAIKWNSPLYGIEEGCWFLGLHCFEKYIKVAFLKCFTHSGTNGSVFKVQASRFAFRFPAAASAAAV